MAQRQTAPAVRARSTRSPARNPTRSGDRGGPRAADQATEVASTAADQASNVASTAADQASDVATTASEQGREVVAVAAEQAREVSGAVRDQAARVGSEVVDQGRSLAEEARAQLEQQAQAQSRRLADSLSKFGNEVRALAEGRPEDAENVQPYVANAADAVYDAADRLYGLASDIDTRGIGGVLDDLQSFARRRPGAFLAGAAIAGFGIGRVVRANSGSDDSQGAQSAPPTAARPARAVGAGGAPTDRLAARAAVATAARGR